MKKIIYAILFETLLLIYTNAFASDIEYNTDSNVKKAILVEDYVIRHKEKINEFIINYDIKNNIDLNNDLRYINESIDALKRIQNTTIEKKKAEEVMQAVLDRLKYINEALKIKLKFEKEKYKEKLNKRKEAYSLLWKKLSEKIYNINLKIARKIIKNNENLSITELDIKDNLVNLNKESQKLKNFWNMNFKSESEMKESFINILRNIKVEIVLMSRSLN